MFRLSCESTVDLPFSYVNERQIPVLCYSYAVDGHVYADDMGRTPDSLSRFYQLLAEGKVPTTSQLTACQYEEFFEPLLKEGDLIHIVFSSGLSGSINGALVAARTLREKYPERRLTVVDSLCGSSGYGLLIDAAADLRDRGASMDEVEEWLLDNRLRMHHQFYSADLRYYRRTGRVSGAAATIGSVLGICPILHLDASGKIVAYDKVRGKAKAIARTVDAMLESAENGANYAGKCWISHSNCLSDAEKTKALIEANFPKIQEVRIFDIGVIIASHSGPNTVAVYYFGSERKYGVK